MTSKIKILSFDIEEWFHLLDVESTNKTDQWSRFESRIEYNVERLLSLVDESGQKATFFCLGWIAENYPNIIKLIDKRGYEIGTHSSMHRLVYEQTPSEFHADLEHSISVLENIIGKKISCFRAPGFSITKNTPWAFDIMNELGIEIDSSIFPAVRAHGGYSSFGDPVPTRICYNGISIKELPISYIKMLNIPLVYSGGGFFRLMPYCVINRWLNKQDYVMTYFHPRDFDPGQPRIDSLSLKRKFKSYIGIATAEKKFLKMLHGFRFMDVAGALNSIDWNNVPIIRL